MQRRLAEEALRESKEQYRNVVESANEGIFVIQDDRICFANPKILEISGYSLEELSSRPVIELVHPEDRKMMRENHLWRLEGEKLSRVYAFRIIHKSGAIRWLETNAVLIKWMGRPATMNFVSDITEHKLSEQALVMSEKRQKELTDLLPVLVFEFSSDGTITFVNRRGFETFGYSEADLKAGLNAIDMIVPEEREMAKRDIIRVLQGEVLVVVLNDIVPFCDKFK